MCLNNRFIKHTIPLYLLLNGVAAHAQSTAEIYRKKMMDSIKLAMVGEFAKAYPLLRQVIISNDIIGTTRSYTDLYGKRVVNGKLRVNRTLANINLPLAAWQRKNVINLALSYSHQYLQFKERTSSESMGAVPLPDDKRSFNTYGFVASYVRSDSLFKLPVVYSVSINGVSGTFRSLQKLSYMGSAIFTFRRTATTSLSAGAIVILDPSLPFPVVPVVSYYHQFKPSGLQLLIDLPQRIMLRKQLTKKSWATFGTEVASSVAFMNLSQYRMPDETNFSTFDLKSGVTVEHQLTRKLVVGISGGLFSTVSSRIFQRNEKSNDYIISNKNNSTPYLNVSLSLLPFLKPFIR